MNNPIFMNFLKVALLALSSGVCLQTYSAINSRTKTNPYQWYDKDGDGIIETYYDGIYNTNHLGYLGDSWFFIRDYLLSKNGETDVKLNFNYLNGGSYYTADINNDGRLELIATNARGLINKAIVISTDATQFFDSFEILSWNEYNNLRSELKLTTGGEGIPGWGDMYGRDGVSLMFDDFKNIDINGDGLVDMINGTNGSCYLNVGSNRFVEKKLGSKVDIRDFNNDGFADMIVFDKTSLQISLNMPDGRTISSEIYQGPIIPSKAWCYDFDRDGDVDIVAPIDYSRSGEAFLLYFENDGRGNFTMNETWIEGDVIFCDCVDIDSDGYYEAIGHCKTNEGELRAYKIVPSKFDGGYTTIVNARRQSDWLFINKDNDGTPYLVFGATGSSTIYSLSDKKNQRPSAPGKVTINYDGANDQLRLNWTKAKDAESSWCDLTYELRVGTAPDKDDILGACALPDGRRRRVGQGSNGYATYRTIDVSSWPLGKYYISVQAVDPNQQGSVFSEPAVFEKRTPGCMFSMDVLDYASPGDTITVSVIGGSKTGIEYKWDFADATIIEQSPDNAGAKIRFTTGGDKTIRLIATGGGGSSTYSRLINLLPVGIRKDDNRAEYMADIDCDGSDEFYYSRMFYEQNAKGDINAVHKSWNANLDFKNIIPVDVDKDGLIDFLDNNGIKSRIIKNNGNKNLTKGEEFSNCDMTQYVHFEAIADFDNDGNIEALVCVHTTGPYYYDVVKFSSDCKSYTQFHIDLDMTKIQGFIDINGDGLLDLYGTDNEKKSRIYYNRGNLKFDAGEELPKDSDGKYPAKICDIDFDGKVDYVYCSSSYAFGVSSYDDVMEVVFGNGRMVEIECPDGRPFYELHQVFDFDNNGMADILIAIQEVDSSISGVSQAVVYFKEDYSTEVVNYEYDIDAYGQNTPVVHLNSGDLIVGYNRVETISNERPGAPADLRSSTKDGFVIIEWTGAHDAETPDEGLLYNISLSKSAQTGDGAYIISPMNMGKDDVSVPTNHTLVRGKRFAVPISALPAGEYDVKVQAVDGQLLAGKFSPVYKLTVNKSIAIEAPTEAMIGTPISVKVISNSDVTVDFGSGANVTKDESGDYLVAWKSEGLKNIMADGKVMSTVLVHGAIDCDFEMPENILAGSRVEIACSNALSGVWEISDGQSFLPAGDSKAVESFVANDHGLRFTVACDKNITLRHTVTTNYGEAVKEKMAAIITAGSKPEITAVVAGTSGYVISWGSSEAPAEAVSMRVYRETNRYNQLELIATVPIADGEYIDNTSHPDVQAERYALSYELQYGESAMSESHQPIHLQVNKGVAGSINLMWSRYEGQQVDSYIILGGDTPDNLSEVARVSGSKMSYSDKDPVKYYAVGIEMTASMRSRAASSVMMSNVVASANAQDALLIERLEIYGENGSSKIDIAISGKMQLRSMLYPLGASYSQLDWAITSGMSLASISDNGLVTAHSEGKITVTATTRDGSDLSASIDLEIVRIGRPITWLAFKSWPTNYSINVGETFKYVIEYNPLDATEHPIWESTHPEIASVDQKGNVVGLSAGKTNIVVKSGLNPDMFIDLGLTVIGPSIPVEDIILSKNEIIGEPGQTVHVDLQVFPENATNKSLIWEVYPYASPIVSINGSDTGVDINLRQLGNATVLCYPVNGDVTRMISVEVVEDAAVDEVYASDMPCDVYSPQGILIKSNVTIDEVRLLPVGIYIIRQGSHSFKMVNK